MGIWGLQTQRNSATYVAIPFLWGMQYTNVQVESQHLFLFCCDFFLWRAFDHPAFDQSSGFPKMVFSTQKLPFSDQPDASSIS
jgi:hypothetical protein